MNVTSRSVVIVNTVGSSVAPFRFTWGEWMQQDGMRAAISEEEYEAFRAGDCVCFEYEGRTYTAEVAR